MLNFPHAIFNVTGEDYIPAAFLEMYICIAKKRFYLFLTRYSSSYIRDGCFLTIFIAFTEECTDYISEGSIG